MVGKKEVVVLRYGHRVVRDARVTTHCCLVARAFGADGIIIVGAPDEALSQRIKSMEKKWGQAFSVVFADGWRRPLTEYQKKGYTVVHLTMKGKGLASVEKELKKKAKLLVIIGSQKVETEVYKKSDFNVAIGRQPHSEVAALAVFLDHVVKRL